MHNVLRSRDRSHKKSLKICFCRSVSISFATRCLVGGINEPERRSESNISQKNTARPSPKAVKKMMVEDQVIPEENYQEISNRTSE